MASKKRRFEQLQAAAATPQQKKTYVDPFQQQVVPRLETVEKKLEGKGKTILYAVGLIAVLIIAGVLVLRWTRGSSAAAQAALGKAIETSQAQISETGPLAGAPATARTFKTEKERADAAIAEFQAVVDKHGGSVGEKAKYFIAVNKLNVDRPAAVQELEGLSRSGGEVGTLAKFALAQTRADDNRLDEALTLYNELVAMSDPVIAKETINFQIARIYEKQGKKAEALALYFDLAKAAAEAKDSEGKPLPPTQTATEAKQKVKEIDPEKAKEIPEPTPASPFGS